MSNIGPNILETKNLQQYYSGSKAALFIILLFTVHFYGYETSMHPYQVVKFLMWRYVTLKTTYFQTREENKITFYYTILSQPPDL